MPEEIFIIIIIAIIAGTLSGIVSQIFSYLKSKAPDVKEDASLTTSELENMIQKWIGEATRPLATRLDDIENRLGEERPALGEKSILDDMDGYEEKEEKDRAPAPRQRTKR